MPPATPLLLGVHAHQPIGNFPEVIDDAVTRCYHPFFEVLSRYPEFPFAVHISGWLLGYMLEHHPATTTLLIDMVARGQTELVGAGDTEPVLAAIPYLDRVEQVEAMSERLEQAFGVRPQGAWLTERVWDPSVVPALVDAGIRYVMVDDYHFLCAGVAAEALGGFYRTEENGQAIDVFPISERLRYLLPFSEAGQAIAEIGGRAGQAAIYFDDIEKFGLWPETYDWVYGRGWLEQFIQGALAHEGIVPTHYRDFLAQQRPLGIVYLPTVSYSEMNAWTLPPAAAHQYEALLHQEREAGRLGERKALIRGGIWKNFLSRYPEGNWMHKRMLQLSARFHALPKRRQSPAMRAALHAAQANDAYWHGLFGGIYLPHLRRAVYHALLTLESLLDGVQKRPTLTALDIDLDGREEWLCHDAEAQIIVAPEPFASIVEWDHYGRRHNFADTLARRDEAYYEKIRQGASTVAPEHGGIVSAHDRVSFKTQIGVEDLVFDDIPCQSFIDRLGDVRLEYRIEGENKGLRFVASAAPSHLVHKAYQLRRGVLQVDYRLTPQDAGSGEIPFGTRLYLAMPSCDGPGGRLLVDDILQGGLGTPAQGSSASLFAIEDDVLQGRLELRMDRPVAWQVRPHWSISQSEAGFERIMQALILDLQWSVALGQEWTCVLTGKVQGHGG